MDGTEILQPLSFAIDDLSKLQKETRVFLRTDGDVSNPDRVISKALTGKDSIQIHTFGLGDGCNMDMILRVAANGGGSCSFAKDTEENLKGLVITALALASEPSLQGGLTVNLQGD